MKQLFCGIVLLGLCALSLATKERNIGIFNVVKFKNEACNSTSNKLGTCYTQEECEDRGGSASGSCAEGYGVCCVFSIAKCGEKVSENNTFFENPSTVANGECNMQVCKCASNVCQMRLDFESFVIAGPSTNTNTIAKTAFGVVATGGAIAVSNVGSCNTDTFAVTGPNGAGAPVICGTNTGQHMYIEASDDCDNLMFHISDQAQNAMRSWNIKVTQIACGDSLLAPAGCTQYYYDNTGNANKGTIESFNYNGGQGIHLASQNQLMCIRREKNMCRICYATAMNEHFILTVKGEAAVKMGLVGNAGDCGGYGADGMMMDYDFVHIPGATKKATLGEIIPTGSDNFCGGKLTTADMMTDEKTVCSQAFPFQVRFVSDDFEFDAENAPAKMAPMPSGFRIAYEQFSC